MSQKSVLFICLGNICRSPTAEGVFIKMAQNKTIKIDSAGTADFHVGEAPDSRSIQHAKKRGYDLSGLRARQFTSQDFDNFDYIVVMDDSNYSNVKKLATNDNQIKKISKLTDYLKPKSKFAPYKSVPDPYHEGPDGFEIVLDLVEECCEELLKRIDSP